MGLDMYLTGKSYLSSYRDSSRELSENIAAIVNSPFPVEGVIIKLGYWRKANAIHRWFVTNVQSGEDDCRHYYVSKEKLETLLETVNAVLKDHSKAAELLPTQGGFFFVGTAYDDFYFQVLEDTKQIIKKVLDSDVQREYDIEYHASW